MSLVLLVKHPAWSSIRHKTWQKKLRIFLVKHADSWVFHSRHVKAYTTHPQWLLDQAIGYFSKGIEVRDKTEHYDKWLLTTANRICKRAAKRGYRIEDARSILLHYLSNMSGLSYKDEIKYHQARIKELRKLVKHHTCEKDHGWELTELRKAGLIK